MSRPSQRAFALVDEIWPASLPLDERTRGLMARAIDKGMELGWDAAIEALRKIPVLHFSHAFTDGKSITKTILDAAADCLAANRPKSEEFEYVEEE